MTKKELENLLNDTQTELEKALMIISHKQETINDLNDFLCFVDDKNERLLTTIDAYKQLLAEDSPFALMLDKIKEIIFEG